MVFDISRGAQLLKIWIAFRILLIAWRLTLFLEGNYYYPCQRQKGLGLLSLLEPRVFQTDWKMCEPLALFMLLV